MIASVSGQVSHVTPESVVVLVGGFGVLVNVTEKTAFSVRIGEHLELYTSLVVREDALTLYGFASLDERATFELAMGVSGIGPRIALGIVGTMEPSEFRLAIARDDINCLTKVSGIGKKGAERLILELREKVGAHTSESSTTSWRASVASGLESLGWTPAQADSAVRAIAHSVDDANPDIAAALRMALQQLGSA